MSTGVTRRVTGALIISLLTLFGGGMSDYILPANSQTQPELKKFNPQVVTEEGCPVEVLQANTQMEVDPFGTPIAARHYIDYRNASNRPVAAVKFRIGYVDDDGKVQLPYLNAPDAHTLNPGEQATQKWRGDHVGPRTSSIKIRVLMVKYADGSVWESQKVQATENQQSPQGFVPLQTESQQQLLSDRIPGTPVQFHDYGSQQYKQYPEKTATGTVPLSSPQGMGAPPSVNSFGAQQAVPMTAVPMTAVPMTAAPMTAAPMSAAPMSAVPMTAVPAQPMSAAPQMESFPTPTAATPMPTAAAPPTAPAQVAAPSYAPSAAATKPSSSSDDPLAVFDSLVGGKRPAPTSTPPTPTLAPSPPPATTDSALPLRPQMAPPPDSRSGSGI